MNTDPGLPDWLSGIGPDHPDVIAHRTAAMDRWLFIGSVTADIAALPSTL